MPKSQKPDNTGLLRGIGEMISQLFKAATKNIWKVKLDEEIVFSPEINIPEIKVPDIKIKVPEIKVPDIKSPDVKVNVPPIKVPEAKVVVKVPEIKVPDVIVPKINVPKAEITVNVPPVKVKYPEPETPKDKVRIVRLRTERDDEGRAKTITAFMSDGTKKVMKDFNTDDIRIK